MIEGLLAPILGGKGSNLTLLEFFALQKVLLLKGIDFDVRFVSGTRRAGPTLTLTIHFDANTVVTIAVQVGELAR